mmetsp:Transcript_21549/g.48651  ORF Transcript_21549/g.48651 Transcript_21549/m.48651 type:complete len:675 (-) Transcript_21549:1686-3710(-)
MHPVGDVQLTSLGAKIPHIGAGTPGELLVVVPLAEDVGGESPGLGVANFVPGEDTEVEGGVHLKTIAQRVGRARCLALLRRHAQHRCSQTPGRLKAIAVAMLADAATGALREAQIHSGLWKHLGALDSLVEIGVPPGSGAPALGVALVPLTAAGAGPCGEEIHIYSWTVGVGSVLVHTCRQVHPILPSRYQSRKHSSGHLQLHQAQRQGTGAAIPLREHAGLQSSRMVGVVLVVADVVGPTLQELRIGILAGQLLVEHDLKRPSLLPLQCHFLLDRRHDGRVDILASRREPSLPAGGHGRAGQPRAHSDQRPRGSSHIKQLVPCQGIPNSSAVRRHPLQRQDHGVPVDKRVHGVDGHDVGVAGGQLLEDGQRSGAGLDGLGEAEDKVFLGAEVDLEVALGQGIVQVQGGSDGGRRSHQHHHLKPSIRRRQSRRPHKHSAVLHHHLVRAADIQSRRRGGDHHNTVAVSLHCHRSRHQGSGLAVARWAAVKQGDPSAGCGVGWVQAVVRWVVGLGQSDLLGPVQHNLVGHGAHYQHLRRRNVPHHRTSQGGVEPPLLLRQEIPRRPPARPCRLHWHAASAELVHHSATGQPDPVHRRGGERALVRAHDQIGPDGVDVAVGWGEFDEGPTCGCHGGAGAGGELRAEGGVLIGLESEYQGGVRRRYLIRQPSIPGAGL